MIEFLLLQNRTGKTRLAKFYTNRYTVSQKKSVIQRLASMISKRDPKQCNFIEWEDCLIVYKRYASLYFILCISNNDNEFVALEMIHQYVEVLDKYFGNVCELDVIFNFAKAHYCLEQMICGGYITETSKNEVLSEVNRQDELESKIKEAREKKRSAMSKIFA